MPRRPRQPSRRLLSAAAAEHAGIERQREQLLAQRKSVQAELAELDAELTELDERRRLIERLTGPNAAMEATAAAQPSADQGKTVLRGPAIRQTAVKIMLADPRHPQALHYRDWFALLEQRGYAVAGKDPLAVFLTQLSRSPVIRRGTQSGVYELDLDAACRLRHQLEERQRQLRSLTSASPSTTDLSGIRSRRTAITQEIDKLEKGLEEADLTIGISPSSLAVAG